MNIKKHITEDCTSFSLVIFKKKDVEMLARKPFKTLTHIILKSFSIDKKIQKRISFLTKEMSSTFFAYVKNGKK